MELCRKIEEAGAWVLAVHGRTKEQNKHLVGACDWDIIRDIKKMLKIPVVANGGIHFYEDVEKCFEHTKVDGVMSAEALLENPALFSGKLLDLDDLALEYLECWKQYENGHTKYIKPHLFKILHQGLSENVDLRKKMVECKTIEDYENLCKELKERRKDKKPIEKFGWYERYQNYAPQKDQPNEKKLPKNLTEGKRTEENQDVPEEAKNPGAESPNKKVKTE